MSGDNAVRPTVYLSSPCGNCPHVRNWHCAQGHCTLCGCQALELATSTSEEPVTAHGGTEELLDDLETTKVELGEFIRYAQLLEAEVCHCQPQLHKGEYLHDATCRVAEIQMTVFGCPDADENGKVGHILCHGPHQEAAQ